MKKTLPLILLLMLVPLLSQGKMRKSDLSKPVILGIERSDVYLPLLEGKRVGLLSNSTAVSGENKELSLDILLRHGVNVTTIFSPEHGFRGFADAGADVPDKVDGPTGIYISSLFRRSKGEKSGAAERMDSIDVIIVDIQDIGLRYFTYYISMMQLMDLAVEYDKEFVVFDRPNPNGSYVDGPVLDMKYKSTIGVIPIPVVHGMTLGELATMINAEGWLKDGRQLEKLTVVECLNYDHQRRFWLTVKSAPNLRTQHSIYLYPSTCYFEGTVMSLGRGTELSFEVYGHPSLKDNPDIKDRFNFTPQSISGALKPVYLGQTCYGRDLRLVDDEKAIRNGVDLSYIIDAYHLMGDMGDTFFKKNFERLIGCDYVRKMIIAGNSAEEIKACWAEDVKHFSELRRKYLRYKE